MDKKDIKKVVLAYSGGLDTSIIIPWLKENYNNCEVIAVAADVGQGSELEGLEEKAKKTGASKLYIADLKKEFVEDYVFPTIQAGAVYENKYLLVINAANIAKDEEWIQSHLSDRRPDGKGFFHVDLELISEVTSELAIQGPEAEKVVEEVLGIQCADLKFYTFKETTFEGKPVLISRTGYTGEDGFEVYATDAEIEAMWDKLMASGRCAPCGLGCRDTLRFEVGLPLYGDELADDITPVEAGLSMFVKLDKPYFIGREAIAKQKAEGPKRRIVGLELTDRAVPRHGYEVLDADGNVVGAVTTGYHGLSVDKSIAMAMVDARCAAMDTPLQVRIRRKTFPCRVVRKQFYKKSYK